MKNLIPEKVRKKMFLLILKFFDWIQFPALIVLAFFLALAIISNKPAVKEMVTTHDIYLPSYVERLEAFESNGLPQASYAPSRYFEIVKNYKDNFMSINSSRLGTVLSVNYYLKDERLGIILHAAKNINSPRANWLMVYAPQNWIIQGGKLVVERLCQIENEETAFLIFFLIFIVICVVFYIFDLFSSRWLRKKIQAMEKTVG